jgi:hypothetical protein
MIKLTMEVVVENEAQADKIAVTVCETFLVGVSVKTEEIREDEDE